MFRSRLTLSDGGSNPQRMTDPRDTRFMARALELAQASAEAGEAPIGAVVVDPATDAIVAEATTGRSPDTTRRATRKFSPFVRRRRHWRTIASPGSNSSSPWNPVPCAPERSVTLASAGWCTARRMPRGARSRMVPGSSSSRPAIGGRRSSRVCLPKRAPTCCVAFSGRGESRPGEGNEGARRLPGISAGPA